MKPKRRILLLDDHSIFLNGLKELISRYFEGADFISFTSIHELKKAKIDFTKYDLLISDMDLPNENSHEFLKEVKSSFEIPILVVSMHKKVGTINLCKALKIDGYILKNDSEFLIEAIERIIGGEIYFSPEVKKLLKSSESQNVLTSTREIEVIKCICRGLSNTEIADKLFISIETVKTHKRNIKAKLGLDSSRDIVEYGMRNYII